MDGISSNSNPNSGPPKIAILWRGDREARRAATPQNNRFHRVFEELAAVGIAAEPAVYAEEFAEEVKDQLLAVDGVLVWVDPLHQGLTRTHLDALLREIAARGPWVSAHPDVILKMGVKEVLHRTRHLGWGTDTRLRELMIMRIGWVTGSVYEWTNHWRVATTAGIPAEDILAVRDWRNSDRLTAADRAILAATDESLAGKSISDAAWAEVAKHVADPGQQVEFIVAMGNWLMFSMLFRNLRIPLAEGVAVWPPDGVASPAADGWG